MNNSVSQAITNGFLQTLDQLPKEEGEQVAAKVAKYLKKNYIFESAVYESDKQGTPIAKRRAAHVNGPSPMLRLMDQKENYELITQLNNLVKTLNDSIQHTSNLLNQDSNLQNYVLSFQRLKVLGAHIALTYKVDQASGLLSWPKDWCKNWNRALIIVCEGCINPIFDETLDAEAQAAQRERVYELLDKLQENTSDSKTLDRIKSVRYIVENNYYSSKSSECLNRLIMNDFISRDNFKIFYTTLKLLFDCCQFNPQNPLNTLSPKVLDAINQSFKT